MAAPSGVAPSAVPSDASGSVALVASSGVVAAADETGTPPTATDSASGSSATGSTSSSPSTVPVSLAVAAPPLTLRDPLWLAVMREEFDVLQRNRTWHLVLQPPHANVISGHKTHPDGSLRRYKDRRVVCGFRQHAGVDFTDTFAPVVKTGMIRVVLQLFASRT
nr:uncharacterized mitochondrial protein AtMg00820-like [Aegilops tauschii subsp. strangulata]